MKKTFTLILTLALMAASAMAFPKNPLEKHYNGLKAQKVEQMESAKKMNKLVKSFKKQALRRAPGVEDIVDEQPAGELKIYNLYAQGLEVYYFWIVEHDSTVPTPGQIVYDGNTVWFGNIISSLSGYGWVKGTLSDDGKSVTVQFPQAIAYTQTYESDADDADLIEVPVYVGKMKKVLISEPAFDIDGNPMTDDNGDPVVDEYEDFVPVDDPAENVAVYTVNEDGTLSLQGGTPLEYDEDDYVVYPESMIAAYYYETEDTPWWVGCGDCMQNYEQLGDDVIFVEVPENLEYEEWEFADLAADGRFIKMAKDGNDVYLTDLWDRAPEAVIKGSINADGTVVFPSKQYLGIDTSYNCFLTFCGANYDTMALTEDFCFTYDADFNCYESGESDIFMLNASFEEVDPFNYMFGPSIYHSTAEEKNAAPMNPEFGYYEDYQEEYGQDYFEWYLSPVNVEGAVMPKDKLYYNLYINDELYTFYNDEYLYLPEAEMTDMPYGFCDDFNYDIYALGTAHCFYICGQGINSCGIKLYYENPEGELKSSDLVTYLIDEDEVVISAVENVAAEKEVSRVVYTNMQGMRVTNPQSGDVYVRSLIFSDGSRQSCKVIKK